MPNFLFRRGRRVAVKFHGKLKKVRMSWKFTKWAFRARRREMTH